MPISLRCVLPLLSMLAGCGGCQGTYSECTSFPARSSIDVSAAFVGLDLRDCQSANCGGNSPTMNAFPLNGLHPDHRCKNPQGIRVVERSVTMPDTTADARCRGGNFRFDVDDDGTLVATKGNLRCPFEQGTTFIVATDARRATISVATKYEQSANDDTTHPSYEMKGTITTAQGTRSDYLCNPAFARDWLATSLGLTPIDTRDLAGRASDHKAIAFRAELYGQYRGQCDVLDLAVEKGQHGVAGDWLIVEERVEEKYKACLVERKLAPPGDGWINIACVPDALAKLDLYAMAPHEADGGDEYLRRRVGALHLLTGNYCGVRHYTANDISIAWLPAIVKLVNHQPEAIWDDGGAQCLYDNPRIFDSFFAGTYDKESVPSACLDDKKNCDTAAKMASEIRAECDRGRPLGSCMQNDAITAKKKRRWRSYLPPPAPSGGSGQIPCPGPACPT